MRRLLVSDIIQPSVEGTAKYFSRSAGESDFEGLMDPILAINHFETTATIPVKYWHKDALEIFYVFEDSSAYKRERGEEKELQVNPGELLWTKSLDGTKHTHSAQKNGSRTEGIQLFINKKIETGNPGTFTVDKTEMPVIETEGVQVKVLCGKSGEVTCPAKTPADFTMLHISVEAGKDFRHLLPANWSGTLFALEGRFDVMTTEETFQMEEGMVISMGYSEYNESIVFTGLTNAKLLFVSGHPIKETAPKEELFEKEPRFVPEGTHNLEYRSKNN